MRMECFSVLALCVLASTSGIAAEPQVASPASTPGTNVISGPKIVFDTPVFDFGRISSGEVVKHTFYFTNAGTEKLVISNVQPSCGCTAAGTWSREVEPGKAGSIPIQFNSGSFGGPVAKSITVASNDKQQSMAYLQIRATIWKPIDVMPTYAVINVSPDSEQGSAKVMVTNNLEHPVYLWGAEINNPGFNVQLTTNTPGKAYELVVATVPPAKPGTLQAQVSVKTSSTNTPVLQVSAWANVQPAVTVLPPSLNLPASPLASAVTPAVTIINNSTNSLTLTNATVNTAGVDVQVKELQPGKYFSVLLSFPQGFEAPKDKAVEFSVESSHPKFKLIKIPVYQAKAPAPVAAPATVPAAPKTSLNTAPAAQPARVRHELPKMSPPPLPDTAPAKQTAGS